MGQEPRVSFGSQSESVKARREQELARAQKRCARSAWASYELDLGKVGMGAADSWWGSCLGRARADRSSRRDDES